MVKINNENNKYRTIIKQVLALSLFCFGHLSTASAEIMSQDLYTKDDKGVVSIARDPVKAPYVSKIKVDKDNNVKVIFGNITREQTVKVAVFNYDKSQKDTCTFGNRDVVVVSGSKNYFDMNFIALDPNNKSEFFWIFIKFPNGTEIWKPFRVNPAVL